MALSQEACPHCKVCIDYLWEYNATEEGIAEICPHCEKPITIKCLCFHVVSKRREEDP